MRKIIKVWTLDIAEATMSHLQTIINMSIKEDKDKVEVLHFGNSYCLAGTDVSLPIAESVIDQLAAEHA